MTLNMSVEPIYSKFGEILRLARQKRQMSQVELAKEVGMSRSSLSNIEAGRQRVYLDQCFSLASALNLPQIELLLPTLSDLTKDSVMDSKPTFSSSQGLTETERKLFEQAYNV